MARAKVAARTRYRSGERTMRRRSEDNATRRVEMGRKMNKPRWLALLVGPMLYYVFWILVGRVFRSLQTVGASAVRGN